MADSTRLRILHLLMEGVQRNSELGDPLGMPPNLVLHRLFVLREAGLRTVERDPDDARSAFHLRSHEALES